MYWVQRLLGAATEPFFIEAEDQFNAEVEIHGGHKKAHTPKVCGLRIHGAREAIDLCLFRFDLTEHDSIPMLCLGVEKVLFVAGKESIQMQIHLFLRVVQLVNRPNLQLL